MRTFEDEIRELNSWYFKEHDKIDEQYYEQIMAVKGLDGEHTVAIQKLQIEYRTKCAELRRKHSIEDNG